MEQRQVAPDCRHDPDARVRIAEAGVDVHATDDGAAHGLLIPDLELSVTIPRRGGLIPLNRKGMGRGGHHRGAVPLGRLHNEPAGLAQRPAHFRH